MRYLLLTWFVLVGAFSLLDAHTQNQIIEQSERKQEIAKKQAYFDSLKPTFTPKATDTPAPTNTPDKNATFTPTPTVTPTATPTDKVG